MAGPVPKSKKISDFKPLFTKVAQTSHYQVTFGGFSPYLRRHLARKDVGPRFIGDELGLLCNSASLPGSSLATSEIRGNHMGVMEKHAHQRLFTDIVLDFYVDNDYKSLKFLEHWIEFTAGASRNNDLQGGYSFRMQYPDDYKTDYTKIVKFERDYDRYIEYTFIGLFPKDLQNLRVTYEGSQVLKAQATFTFDRYVSGETTSKSWWIGSDRNNDSVTNQNTYSRVRKGSTFNPPEWLNRDLPSRILQDQLGRNFANNVGRNVARTLGGAMLGGGSSSTFEIF